MSKVEMKQLSDQQLLDDHSHSLKENIAVKSELNYSSNNDSKESQNDADVQEASPVASPEETVSNTNNGHQGNNSNNSKDVGSESGALMIDDKYENNNALFDSPPRVGNCNPSQSAKSNSVPVQKLSPSPAQLTNHNSPTDLTASSNASSSPGLVEYNNLVHQQQQHLQLSSNLAATMAGNNDGPSMVVASSMDSGVAYYDNMDMQMPPPSASSSTTRGLNSIECETCGLVCAGQSHYQVHIRSHTGERPYKCDKCNQAFTQKGNLRRHSKIHSDEKPFHCTECSYKCRRRDALNGHMRIHSDTRPYRCCYCTRSYKSRQSLKEHEHQCSCREENQSVANYAVAARAATIAGMSRKNNNNRMAPKRRGSDVQPTMMNQLQESMMRIGGDYPQIPKPTSLAAEAVYPRPSLTPSLLPISGPTSSGLASIVTGGAIGGSSGKRKAANPQKRPRLAENQSSGGSPPLAAQLQRSRLPQQAAMFRPEIPSQLTNLWSALNSVQKNGRFFPNDTGSMLPAAVQNSEENSMESQPLDLAAKKQDFLSKFAGAASEYGGESFEGKDSMNGNESPNNAGNNSSGNLEASQPAHVEPSESVPQTFAPNPEAILQLYLHQRNQMQQMQDESKLTGSAKRKRQRSETDGGINTVFQNFAAKGFGVMGAHGLTSPVAAATLSNGRITGASFLAHIQQQQQQLHNPHHLWSSIAPDVQKTATQRPPVAARNENGDNNQSKSMSPLPDNVRSGDATRAGLRVLCSSGAESENEPQELKAYYCVHCRCLFLDPVVFAIHVGSHGFRDPFECNICGHRSGDIYQFYTHLMYDDHGSSNTSSNNERPRPPSSTGQQDDSMNEPSVGSNGQRSLSGTMQPRRWHHFQPKNNSNNNNCNNNNNSNNNSS